MGLVSRRSRSKFSILALVARRWLLHSTSPDRLERDDDRLSPRHCFANASGSTESLSHGLGQPVRNGGALSPRLGPHHAGLSLHQREFLLRPQTGRRRRKWRRTFLHAFFLHGL